MDTKQIAVIWDHLNGDSTTFSVVGENEIVWSFEAFTIPLGDQGKVIKLRVGPSISNCG